MNTDKTMTSRELVKRALVGEPVPRPAVGPLASHYHATVGGVTLRDYTLKSDVLADCVIKYHRKFQPDAIWMSSDTWVNASALGVPCDFPGDNQPMAAADIDRIPSPDPKTQGRWPLMLDAMRRIRKALPDVFVIGCFDQYPFSLACCAMGMERVMTEVVDNPGMVKALMGRCADYTVAYACALAEAGADMLSGGASSGALLGPELYAEIAAPFERQVIARIKASVKMPVSLHMCGNAKPVLKSMAESGADVLEMDQRTDMRDAVKVIPRNVAIWGNLDPVAVLAHGTPADVVREVKEYIGIMDAAGHKRYVVSSGCTLAMETPDENLHALVNAVKNWPNV